MKSTLLVTLMICLVASEIPAAAQEPGPVSQAITRQAGKLVTQAASSGAQQASRPRVPEWSRVRKVKPGAQVIVTVKGLPPGTRYFVLANDFELTVLDLADPLLPAAAKRVLRDMASHEPERLAAAQKRHVWVEGRVRVGPDAIFVADRRVADLDKVVLTIARTDIMNIEAGHTMPAAAKVGIGIAIGVVGFLALVYQLIPRT
jgi:hypothetical protein